MSTKYEEMCEAVLIAQENQAGYRDRCLQYAVSLYNGFLKYCAIPPENVQFLRWNGLSGDDSVFSPPPEPGSAYSIVGALVLDADGFWRAGLRIHLSHGATVSFAFWVAEQDGNPITKVVDKTYKIDFQNEQQCAEIYNEVVKRVKQSFTENKKPKAKSIGFIADLPPT